MIFNGNVYSYSNLAGTMKKNNPFYVIYCRDVSGGILEWIKNIRFTIPRCEIIDEIATKEFLGLIIEYFFVEKIILN